MAGRKKDFIWNHFHEIETKSGKGLRAKCKHCGKEIQGIVSRLKCHISNCELSKSENYQNSSTKNFDPQVDDRFVDDPQPSASTSFSIDNSGQKHNLKMSEYPSTSTKKLKMDSFIMRTTEDQKKELDTQVARMIYATNMPFHTVENKEFRKCIEKLRPGYIPPREHAISGYLLNDVYESELKKCAKLLKNKIVTLSIDGWSNVHKDPIVCSSITTKEGQVYLIETFDTSGISHTSEYLQDICEQSIFSAEKKFNCKVRSIVTDNAANMTKMRNEMENTDANNTEHYFPVLTFGCSAHVLNLLAKDLQLPDVVEHVVQIIKYFRNHDFVKAPYKKAGGSSLILPQEVRWNSMCDCLISYVNNWPSFVTVVEADRGNIDSHIKDKIFNMAIKRNAEDMIAILKPIATALDHVQSNKCSISDAVVYWKILKSELDKILNKKQMALFLKRYEQALTPAHFLAFLLNLQLKTKYPEIVVTSNEKESAIQFANDKYNGEFLAIFMKVLANSEPFTGTFMESSIIEKLTAIEWWDSFASVKECIKEREIEIIHQLLGATASSAGIERIFSSFNLVHSKLRNRLGVEKASKLVFLFKSLNV